MVHTPSHTPAAIRQARRRDRRTRGFFCVNVEIGDADLDGLVELGLLDRLDRHDREAITAALHEFFDRSACRPLREAVLFSPLRAFARLRENLSVVPPIPAVRNADRIGSCG